MHCRAESGQRLEPDGTGVRRAAQDGGRLARARAVARASGKPRDSAVARLGNAEAAVRESRMAIDLTARDRWEGPKAEQALARVYAELGRTDDALDLIEKLLEITYDDSITLADLRLDPAWDKLTR